MAHQDELQLPDPEIVGPMWEDFIKVKYHLDSFIIPIIIVLVFLPLGLEINMFLFILCLFSSDFLFILSSSSSSCAFYFCCFCSSGSAFFGAWSHITACSYIYYYYILGGIYSNKVTKHKILIFLLILG